MATRNLATVIRSSPRSVPFVATTVSVCAATLVWTVRSSRQDERTQLLMEGNTDRPPTFQIETDLMDGIANKPYLRASSDHRPEGIPDKLRILAIDVQAVRYAFDGECHKHPSIVYEDHIAPPKTLGKLNNKSGQQQQQQQQVPQKTVAKALIQCRKNKKVGVELLEASIADLNPHNIRRVHQFGSPSRNNDKNDRKEKKEGKKNSNPNSQIRIEKIDRDGKVVAALPEDMLYAPWNQYAWIEEVEKRIHGKVMFGEVLTPSTKASRLLFGNVYRETVPSSRRWFEWFLPPILHSDPSGGSEGNRYVHNWASNKPHAVMADGAALQKVPGAIRFLRRTCEEAGVPLFVVNDPRAWGGNTHQDLEEALRDMRKTIKYSIVQQAMRGSGTAFARGRLVGKLETEALAKAKDLGRRTRQAIRDANKRLEQEQERDWSELDAKQLEQKLINHRVIRRQRRELEYTDGMKEVAKKCMEEATGDEGTSVDPESDKSGDTSNEFTDIAPAEAANP